MKKQSAKELRELLAKAEAKETARRGGWGKTGVENKSTLARRKAILEYLEDKETISIHQIKDLIKAKSLGVAYDHINKLRDSGEVVKVMVGTYRATIPTDSVDPAPLEASELEDDNTEAVLDYVSKHIGQTYTVVSMGRDLGIKDGSIFYLVNRLLKRGLLPKGFNRGLKEFKDDMKAPEPSRPSVEEAKSLPEVDPLYAQIEFLTWTYVKDTRNTDLLQFLTWLEDRSKKES